MFDASPEKYIPQFNGYCTNGIVYGIPWGGGENFEIIDGKLYMFGGQGSRDAFMLDVYFGNGTPLDTSALPSAGVANVEQITDLFLKKLVIDYDYVFCMTITRTRSPIYDNALQASYAILNDYRPIRAAAGHDTPFALRVIDTQTLFAAQGITAVEAVRLVKAGEGAPKIRARLEHLALHTQGYMVPPDLYYLRNRARAKGDRSVGLLSAALGSALDIKPILHANRGETGPVAKIKGFEPAVQKLFEHVAQRVERNELLTPTMCLSYGGELEGLRALPGYERLRDACASNNVELFESVMSLTGMVNVGKGAVVVGFAAEGQKFTA